MSILRKQVTEVKFEKAYIDFMKQAEKNVVSGKSEGSRTPFEFLDQNEDECIGIHNHFGQGAASKTPYMNWSAVSVYYIVDSKRIVVGIEEDRYPHLKELKGILRYEVIGRKKVRIAVFYETTKDAIDYNELWEHFMSVCEDLMMHGM